MKAAIQLADLVSDVIRLMHEQEMTAANASFVIVTRQDCWARYKEVLKATHDFLANRPEFRAEISPARTEHSLPPLPKKLSFVSAAAEALARLEDAAPIIELPLHRDRMFPAN